MELDLVFEAPRDSTHRIGARTFRLYERGNLYALPDVYLETEPGVRSQVELQRPASRTSGSAFAMTGSSGAC